MHNTTTGTQTFVEYSSALQYFLFASAV